MVVLARGLVPLIRQIWKKHYGRWNRGPRVGNEAHEIAAYYLGVKPDEVNKKPSGRHKKEFRAKQGIWRGRSPVQNTQSVPGIAHWRDAIRP
jgi:hypothetical protein